MLPSLANLRRLFHNQLPRWRAEVLAVVEEDAVQRDSLEHSSLSHLQSRLALLVRQLRDEFPGWCEHSMEVKIVALVRSSTCTFPLASSRTEKFFPCQIFSLNMIQALTGELFGRSYLLKFTPAPPSTGQNSQLMYFLLVPR